MKRDFTRQLLKLQLLAARSDVCEAHRAHSALPQQGRWLGGELGRFLTFEVT